MLAWRSRQSGRSEVESSTIAQRSAVSASLVIQRSRSSAGAPVRPRAARARRPDGRRAASPRGPRAPPARRSRPASTVTSVEPGASARPTASRSAATSLTPPGTSALPAQAAAAANAARQHGCGLVGAIGDERGQALGEAARGHDVHGHRRRLRGVVGDDLQPGVVGEQDDARGRARADGGEQLVGGRPSAQQQARTEAGVEHAVAVSVDDRQHVGEPPVVLEGDRRGAGPLGERVALRRACR